MSAGTMHTISSHTGKEYERGLLPSAPVTTLPHPGVDVVDGREPESVQYERMPEAKHLMPAAPRAAQVSYGMRIS